MGEKATFKCGVFLPGLAPGNIPAFEGGGTIDAAGGGDSPGGGGVGGGGDPGYGPPPPKKPKPPLDERDPSPGDSVPPGGGGGGGGGGGPSTGGGGCMCVVQTPPKETGGPTTQGETSKGDFVLKRTYTQKCESFSNSEDQKNKKKANNDTIKSNPAPGTYNDNTKYASNYTSAGPPTVTGKASQGCQTAKGCGGKCEDIVVLSYWNRPVIIDPEVVAQPLDGNLSTGVGVIIDGGGGTTGGDGGNDVTSLGGDFIAGTGISIGGAGDGIGTIVDNLGEAGGSLVDIGSGYDKDLGIAIASEFEDDFGDDPGPSTGGGIITTDRLNKDVIISNAINNGEVDLNDPFIANAILTKKPYGIQDSVISFATTPEAPKLVPNDTGFTDFFKPKIDSNLYYILKNKNNTGNWDSTKAAGVTPIVIYQNLSSEAFDIIKQIRNYDGTPLSVNQIFNLVGSRVLDGTLSKLSIKDLKNLAEDSIKRNPVIIKPSKISSVNEVAALSLIDQSKFTVDKDQLVGRDREIMKNWKVLPSDVDMYIPVIVSGVEQRYYINDDGTFIDRVTLSIKDGDYFNITVGGRSERLYAQSEKDHAFVLPESTRQKAISLLGGEGGRILEVSAPASVASGIEFEYSLSSPRQEYYLLSTNLSSLYTRPSVAQSFLLKDTSVEYNLMDTTSVAGIAAADAYIQYKANKRVFMIDESDILLDYIETTSSLNLTQSDIIFDSPKQNKTLPLLTRQIPWYILVYPTNRHDYNLFNSKSQIQEIKKDGSITRVLRCKTSIVPEFSKGQTNKFIRYETVDVTGVDVYGDRNSQARRTVINREDAIFKQAYRKRGELKSTAEYIPSRQKTGFRLLREIINELDTNYELSINGIGKSLTEFDVFSRLTLNEFNKLSRLENFNTIKKAVQNGLINEVKIIPPISKADRRISFNKTQLVQRKSTATVDTFIAIKATNTGVNIVSPDEKGVGGFTPARR